MNESKKPYASVGGTELSLWDITKILLAKIHWLLLAGVVVAAGVYAVVTIFVTPTYESRVSFYVYNSADNSSQGTINNSDLQAAESLATTYSKILASNSVLDSVLSDLRAETSLSRKELSRMVNVSVVSDTQLLEVVATSTDPELACKIANSFAKVAPTEIVRITKAGGVEVVDRPEVATEKSAPRTVFDSAIGFVVGMILASVAIILRMMADTTIYLPEDIEKSRGFISGLEADMKTLAAHSHPEDGFAGMTVKNDNLTDKDNAGAALLEAFKDVRGMEPVPIGTYRGFQMSLTLEDFGKDYVLTLKGQMTHRVTLGKDARGNLTRIDNVLNAMPDRLQNVRNTLDATTAQMEAAKAELGKPFPQEEELRVKSARLAELNAELNIDERTPMEQLADDAAISEKAERPSVLARLKNTPTRQTQDTPEKQREQESR